MRITKKRFTIEKIIEWIDKNVKYEYYLDDKFRKRNKDLFDHKPLNCSDRVRE